MKLGAAALERARTSAPLRAFFAAVQRNCDIADAAHAQDLSLCIYLLEMREFYRWHRALPLGGALDRADVGRWIAERERGWHAFDDEPAQGFVDLPAFAPIAPLDEAAANRALAGEALVYGAGIGRFGRHEFFVAEPIERGTRDGATITIAGAEYVRTMSPTIGASRAGEIVVRSDVLRRWLWTRVEQARGSGAGDAFARAFAAHRGAGRGGGAGDAGDAAAVDAMVATQTEATVLHELGELRAGAALGPEWEAMLASIGRRRTELVVRAVRDLLADCLVTLPAVLARGQPESVHLWFSNLEGMRRQIAPGFAVAYARWVDGDPGALADEAARGAEHWARTARALLAAWRDAGAGAPDALDALSDEIADAGADRNPPPSA